MANIRKNALPKYLELNPHNHTYYYKNPTMPRNANLGKVEQEAVRIASHLNARYRIQCDQEATRIKASVNLGSLSFSEALDAFVEKYIADYCLKASTARLLHQRCQRLTDALGNIQVPMVDTQILREAISMGSQFEQSKLKTLLLRFFRYAKSTGMYPSHLCNPVDDLFVDPLPHKRRERMTLQQFEAIYSVAPQWLRWLMTLAFHLALRRIDLVSLRFDDVAGDRIVSPIRKTDSEARDMEATSVDFPIHPDVRIVLSEARRSSLRVGRCPFIVHREPDRRTGRAAHALAAGRLEHPAQVLPDYASKAFYRIRDVAGRRTRLFEGMSARQLPTLHEIRALSSHLYSTAGYELAAVQELMAHTDPDMTRAYQRGHARKVLRVEMMLPYRIPQPENAVREMTGAYRVTASPPRQGKFPENSLSEKALAA
ncbi:MAG TPA: hypothetical protein VMF64_07475 [Steroidobacteraceae bacterium]|nr:hypothetical protein [Steroidobacteraceae bacterium]